ncbi:MAG: transposase [Muribaculaceae bacterium]|nr:transposase [Muribaculaceae bacterium]
MAYPTDLTHLQYMLIKSSLSGYVPKLRHYPLFRIINAILYVVKTGCQWYMLPKDFLPYRIVYHHWRSLCERHIITTMLHELVKGKRAA